MLRSPKVVAEVKRRFAATMSRPTTSRHGDRSPPEADHRPGDRGDGQQRERGRGARDGDRVERVGSAAVVQGDQEQAERDRAADRHEDAGAVDGARRRSPVPSAPRDQDHPDQGQGDAEHLQGAGPLAGRRSPQHGHESGSGDDRRDHAHVDEGERPVPQDDADCRRWPRRRPAPRARPAAGRSGATARSRAMSASDATAWPPSAAVHAVERRDSRPARKSDVPQERLASRARTAATMRVLGVLGGQRGTVRTAGPGRRRRPPRSRRARARGPRPRPPSCRRTSPCAARSRSGCWRCRRSCRGPRSGT